MATPSRESIVFKAMIFIMVLASGTASWAEQPPCLPAALALSSGPAGVPVAANTNWPTISNAPMEDGFAAFWYCQVSGDDIRVLEMHSTPLALARAGGLQAIQTRYLSNKDEALEALDKGGHTCVEVSPKPQTVSTRPDCVGFLTTGSKAKRYLCLNPSVTDAHEVNLCKYMLTEMAAHWPR